MQPQQPYVFDPSSLHAFLGVLIAIMALTVTVILAPDQHKRTLKIVLSTSFALCTVFVVYLILVNPPQRQPLLMPTPAAQSDAVRREMVAYREEVQRLRKALVNAATVKAEAVAPNVPSNPQCDTPEAKAIAKMVARCTMVDKKLTVCPKDVALGDATAFEYHNMMASLDHVALFFPTSGTTAPLPEDLNQFVQSFTSKSTAVVIARASKTGLAAQNRELSRLRAVFAGDAMKKILPTINLALAVYGEETLYLTEHDARTYGLFPEAYKDIQHLNQSVFIFRFDCAT